MDTQTTEPTELKLHRLRRGNPDAVERWFLDHADLVHTFIYYRVGRDPQLAEELVQETFIAALGKLEAFDPRRGSMPTWLCLLARNRIRRALREKGRYRTDVEPWERIDVRLRSAYRELESSPLPDEALEKQETAELVRMALANLPEKYRLALLQRYYEHRTLEQIAELGGTTEGAAKSLLHRARRAFKATFQTIAESLHASPEDRRATS